MAIRNNGDVRVCCQANISETRGILRDEDGRVINARDCDFREARNAPLMKEVRAKMIKGEWPETCVRCFQEEQSGLTSRRLYESQHWPFKLEDALKITKDNGEIAPDSQPIEYMDIRFGNKCNLACRMCGPTDSDFWYRDHVEITGRNWFDDTHGRVNLDTSSEKKPIAENNPYGWYESDDFWEQLEAASGDVKHIYLAGGEPLLIDEHYRFLNRLIDEGKANSVVLEYNTNGSVLPKKAIELWQHFKLVRLGLSLDGMGSLVEYQRFPLKWKVVEANLRKLNDLDPEKFHSWLACTVTMYNVMHLPEFMDWKLKSGLENINRGTKKPIITHHMAHNPKHLNIRNLPEELKREILSLFETSLFDIQSNYGPIYSEGAERIFKSVSNYMLAQEQDEKYWSQFLDYTEKLDKAREESYQRVLHPSLVRYIQKSV